MTRLAQISLVFFLGLIALPAIAQTHFTVLEPAPVGLTPENPLLEELWGDVFAKIRRPAGPSPAAWDRPPAEHALTFNAALPLDPTTKVGVSALFSSHVGCDMGANDKNAAEQPVVCPGRVALIQDDHIVAIADVPKICISSLMHDRDPAYQTVAALSKDGKSIYIAGARNNVPLTGDFSGVKDCTVAVPIPR